MAAGVARPLLPLLAAPWLVACPKQPPPAPVPPPATVVIEFTNATAATRPLVLFSGQRAGSCRRYEAYIGSPSVALTNLEYAPACPVELDVLTPGFGLYGRQFDYANADDDAFVRAALEAGALAVTLPPLIAVPVRAWRVADAADAPEARDVADELLTTASPILEQLGAGVTLAVTRSDLLPSQVDPNCAGAGAISGNTAIYDAGAVNVYFVENYLNMPYSSYAINCWKEGHQEIIFVSWGNANTPAVVLAHEMGHALGLIRPEDVGGHTNWNAGFTDVNLMYTGGGEYLNISIGQSYRMTFDQLSWINRPGGPSSPMSRPCQIVWGTGPCPALTRFVTGWP